MHRASPPAAKFQGYVVYCQDEGKNVPYGVVSSNYECNAVVDTVPKNLQNFLVAIEDRRFYQHHGVDLKAIIRAFAVNLKNFKISQGGSTITQQLAKNLIKDNSRTLSRKITETAKALRLEFRHSKEDILNLYLNNVYFGGNLRGFRSASLFYFGKELNNLSQREILMLITILRGPNFYLKNAGSRNARLKLISEILKERNLISARRHEKNISSEIDLQANKLKNISPRSIDYIAIKSEHDSRVVKSSIDLKVQSLLSEFVDSSKYPLSIIAIRRGRVLGFASTYGSEYPFAARSNVGSTLKPFLYCHLRDCGVGDLECFSSNSNSLNWNVREVQISKSNINLEDALFLSNNNSFINACDESGMDAALMYLSSVLKRDRGEFFPSSILGATKNGITLYELAKAYSVFFASENLTPSKIDCLRILNRVANDKLPGDLRNAFLKTGTTNKNKERYAVFKHLGDPEMTFAMLRNDNCIDDVTKEGGFMREVSKFIMVYFKKTKGHRWT